MLQRVLLGFVGIVVAAAAGTVMFAGDPLPPPFQPLEEREAPNRMRWGSYSRVPGIFQHDYVDTLAASSGHKQLYHLAATRGEAVGVGRYHLSVEYMIPETGVLARVTIEVTEDGALQDDASWTQLGEATLHEDRGWTVAQLFDVVVDGSINAYRVIDHRKQGKVAAAVASSVPRAPTALGRIRDSLATWPFLRYLPDFR